MGLFGKKKNEEPVSEVQIRAEMEQVRHAAMKIVAEQHEADEKRRSAEEIARIHAEKEKQTAEIERQIQLELAEKKREQKLQKEREQKLQAVLAKNNQEVASNAERWRREEAPAFSIHDIDSENKFIQTKLLEKWDDIFQKQNIIDELRLFENYEEKKRFIAESFSIEFTSRDTEIWIPLASHSDINCLEQVYDLELVYESQGKQLFFKFSKEDNSDSEFVLSFEYKPDQGSDTIKAVIVGTADNPIKKSTLYNFLCSLDCSEIADHMGVFFAKLNEAEQNLPNKTKLEEKKRLEEKYSSALNSLSTL